jgi:hypothetical protein
MVFPWVVQPRQGRVLPRLESLLEYVLELPRGDGVWEYLTFGLRSIRLGLIVDGEDYFGFEGWSPMRRRRTWWREWDWCRR